MNGHLSWENTSKEGSREDGARRDTLGTAETAATDELHHCANAVSGVPCEDSILIIVCRCGVEVPSELLVSKVAVSSPALAIRSFLFPLHPSF